MKKIILFVMLAFGLSASAQLYRPLFEPTQFSFQQTTGGSNIQVKAGASFTNVILKGTITGVTNFTFDANQFVANGVTNISIKSGSLQTNNIWKSGSTKIMEIATTHPQVMFGDGATEGDAGFPSMAFALNSGYGFNLAAGGYIESYINQIARVRFDSVGIKTGLGTAGSPAYSSFSASSSGVYFPDASTFAISGGGTEAARAVSGRLTFATSQNNSHNADTITGFGPTGTASDIGFGYGTSLPVTYFKIQNTPTNFISLVNKPGASDLVNAIELNVRATAGNSASFSVFSYNYGAGNIYDATYINTPGGPGVPMLIFADPFDTSHGSPGVNHSGISGSYGKLYIGTDVGPVISITNNNIALSNILPQGTISVSNGVGNSGQVLTSGGAGQPTSWTSLAAGSVSNVGLSAPVQFSVGGTPVTTSGTLALGWVNVQSNKVFAGPANNGVDAAPTFRSVDVTDLAGGNNASATTFLRGDWQWATPAASAISMDLVTALAASRSVQNGAFTNLDMFTDPGAGKASYTIKGTNSTASTTVDFRGQMTSATASFHTITETTSSTGGSGSQYLLNLATLASSTANPLRVANRGTEVFRIDQVNGRFLSADGSDTTPMYGFASVTTAGLTYASGAVLQYNNSIYFRATSSQLQGFAGGNGSFFTLADDGFTASVGGSGTVYLSTGDSTHKGVELINRVKTTTTGSVTLTSTVAANLSTGPGSVQNNSGASATVTYNLPAAVIGVSFTFTVMDTDGIIIDPNGTDTIQINTAVTTNGGTLSSSTVGNTCTIVCVAAGTWIVTSYVGTVAVTWTTT